MEAHMYQQAAHQQEGSLELQPDTFAADVANAVCQYCQDGCDAFQSCLAQAPGIDVGVLRQIQEGTQQLFDQLQARVDTSQAMFEQICSTHIFASPTSLPPKVGLQPSSAAAKPSSHTGGVVTAATAAAPQQERNAAHSNPLASLSGDCSAEVQALQAQLLELRAKLEQVHASSGCLKADIIAADAQLAQHGDAKPFTDLASAVGGAGKENVQRDLAAIVDAAGRLQPLLERALTARNAREPLLLRSSDSAAAADSKARQQQLAMGSLEDVAAVQRLLTTPTAHEVYV